MVLVPKIDIEKTRGAVTKIVAMSPTKKTVEILLESVDLMMDDMVEARESLEGADPIVDEALLEWDRSFTAFGEREAWYMDALLATDDPEEIKIKIGNPLLRGKYPPDVPRPPDWPDIETPWRLMNEITMAAVLAKKSQSFLDDLERSWKDNFARYWKANSIRLSMHARRLESGETAEGAEDVEVSLTPPEPLPAGVRSFSGTVMEEARGYKDAADSSRSFAQKADDFFSRETWEKFKKSAKHVGIGIVIGILLTILVVVRVRA